MLHMLDSLFHSTFSDLLGKELILSQTTVFAHSYHSIYY